MLIQRFGKLAYRMLPKPRINHHKKADNKGARRLLVLTKGDNPTFSYYLEERLNRSSYPFQVRDLREPLDDIDPDGLYVIICRYIRPRQLLWLYRNRKQIVGAALFLDDDIAATLLAREGEWGYKVYLAAVGILPLPLLNRILTDLWVATPALGRSLESARTRPTVVGPLPPRTTYDSRNKSDSDRGNVVMAFHTGGCHDTEHRFLMPVVREALRRCPNLRFEVTAMGKIAKMWRDADLPAGQFAIHSNKIWADYLADTSSAGIDILLVPLAISRINDVRAGTKRIDAVRMGAAAVLSRTQVYEHSASEGEIFVEYERSAWVKQICCLVADTALRHRSRDATANVVKWIAENEVATFPLHVE